MKRQTRRQFLLSGLAVAGGAFVGTRTPRAPDLAFWPRFSPSSPVGGTALVDAIDTRWPIKRVVYLMLENRSFDHVFGAFPGVNGASVGNSEGREIPLRHAAEWLPGDLPHDRKAGVLDVDGGAMDG